MNGHEGGVADTARALRSGALSSETLTRHLLERAEARQSLNAFMALQPDLALAQARAADRALAAGEAPGPLHGVPLVLKDNIDAAGWPTTAGTPALADHRPPQDAPVVAALRRAGALILGKNPLHELAYGATGNNPCTGPSRNPYDPQRIPGGSSSGTAVAVAARLAPAGIGTDTGGSVRVPAALCGLFGFRPSAGRWPNAGIVPISGTRDTAGPLARHVEDLLLIDEVVTGDTATPTRPLSACRIGVPDAFFWEQLDPDVAERGRATLEAWRRQGVTLVEKPIPDLATLLAPASMPLVFYEGIQDLRRYLADSGSGVTLNQVVEGTVSPDVHGLLAMMNDPQQGVPWEQYLDILRHRRPALITAYATYLAGNELDAIAFPTCPLTARAIGEDDTVQLNGEAVPTFPTLIRNTDPGSTAGLPGVTLPMGLDRAGLPMGIALDALPGRDRALLALARELQNHLPETPPPAAAG